MAGHAICMVDDMEAIYNTLMGHFTLGPETVRVFVDIECHDKLPIETYKDYCARKQGPAFSNVKWKKLCNFYSDKFDTMTNCNDMDLTALCQLLYAVFTTKGKVVSASFLKALRNLKELRNTVMHNINEARDPAAIGKLEAALISFIKEAGRFYSLTANEVQNLENKVKTDVQAAFSPGKKRLQYAKACMVKEGWSTMEQFIQINFETENLMFSMGKVKKTAVFHELEVLLREGKTGHTFPYSEIFEKSEKFIIVSGVAGAGKSTLLENIALQFSEPNSSTPKQLRDFQLLVYIQCRDHTTRTLSHVLIQQYPDVRTKLGEDLVLEAMFKLTGLFLIDGYDEYGHSMTVLKEVVKKTWRAACRVIITTRPHAAKQLEQLLLHENVSCVEFEIAPLEELRQQINFLRKYEPHLPGRLPSGAVRESFKTLQEPLRILFTEPLRLMQFCYFCVNCPEVICSWEKSNDVAKSSYQIYRDLVTKKLIDASYPNLDVVIDDVFTVLCECALESLRKNILTFTDDNWNQVQRKCLDMLRAEHDIKDLGAQVFLSCVFKTKRPLSGNGKVQVGFNHKSDQEYFASRCVADKLRNSCITVSEILSGNEPSADDRFLEVLQYVVQDLGADSPELFEQRWPQLKEALQEAGADFSTWRDLVLRCSDQGRVVRRLAQAARNIDSGRWTADNSQHVEAIALMLPHAQPALLNVEIKADALRMTRWADVLNNREGSLRLDTHSGWKRLPDETCDDVIEPLRNRKGRCTLELFRGTISSVGLTAVAATVTAATELDIRLEAPRHLGRQSVELNCRAFAACKTPPNATDGGEGARQYLAWSPTRLTVKKVVQGSWEAVINSVLTVARPDGRFQEIQLDKEHNLTPVEVDRVLVVLQRRGIRTLGEEHTGCVKSEDESWRLNVSDDLPHRLHSTRDLLELRERVMELSTSRPEQLQDEWPALRNELQAAGACWVDWQDLMLRCPGLEDLARLAAEAKLASQSTWKIRTGHDVAAVARMLPHAQPRRLEADIRPRELRRASWEVPRVWREMPYIGEEAARPREHVPAPVEDEPQSSDGGSQPWREEPRLEKEGPSPWEEVVRLMRGELMMWFEGDTPCDDLLTPLRGTSAQLVKFRGGIAEAATAATLATVAAPASILCVRLLAPLSLRALQGRHKTLTVLTDPFEVADGGLWPLPAQPLPELWVTDIPLGAWRDVVYTIQSLAPASNKYDLLFLTTRYFSPREYDMAAAALQRRGIRTVSAGLTRWTKRDLPSGWYRIKFALTNQLSEELALLD